MNIFIITQAVLGSIVVSIPVCHTGDRGSIPRQGVYDFSFDSLINITILVTI